MPIESDTGSKQGDGRPSSLIGPATLLHWTEGLTRSPAEPRGLVQVHSELKRQHAVLPAVHDEDGAGHVGDALDGVECFVEGVPDEGEEAEGERAGVVQRGGGQGRERAVEDDAFFG